jgi:formate-dependent nitrite reductase membrane component NrfD
MKTIEWGFLIVNYLFLGGLSAGLFFISALAVYLGGRDEGAYTRIARWGALLAPWPVAAGSALLIFDLGNWNRFYLLFLHFKWHSPMSIGSWLLLVFNGVAFIYLWSWLPATRRAWILAKVRLPASFDRDLSSSRRLIAASGLPLSVAVAIYTGVLLGAVQARPFWNTNLVAQMFLFSAISTACALLIVVMSLGRARPDPAELRVLYTLDICLITLEFFVVLPYVIHGELSAQAVRDSLDLILGGPFTLAFWLLFVGAGLLAPLALEVWEVAPALLQSAPMHFNRPITVLAGVMVIAGGYLLRYIFVYAGQISAFR